MLKLNKKVFLRGALAAGLCLSGAAHSALVDISFTGDNEIIQLWTVSGAAATEITSLGGNADNWKLPTTKTVDLAPGEYRVVFYADNLNGAPSSNNPASLLAKIEGAGLAQSVFSDASWRVSTDFGTGSCNALGGFDCGWSTSDFADLTNGRTTVTTVTNAEFDNTGNIWGSIPNGLSPTFANTSSWIWDGNGDGDTNWGSETLLLSKTITVVPLPPAAILFLSAISGVALIGRHRKKRASAAAGNALTA